MIIPKMMPRRPSDGDDLKMRAIEFAVARLCHAFAKSLGRAIEDGAKPRSLMRAVGGSMAKLPLGDHGRKPDSPRVLRSVVACIAPFPLNCLQNRAWLRADRGSWVTGERLPLSSAGARR